ncbi:MAG: T9SS type A sorting domain-containing protein [Flavipsychrobacter sp.]|nr:T9SS type A sorting domain-containing protein [Flavipsychrobacter sp.]
MKKHFNPQLKTFCRRLKPKLFLLSCLLAVYSSHGQNAISTFAGTGEDRPAEITGAPGPRTNIAIDRPYGIALDCSGNVFITEQEESDILRVSNSGTMSVFSGHPLSPQEIWPGSGAGPWSFWGAATSLNSCSADNINAVGFSGDGGNCQPPSATTTPLYGLPAGMVYDPIYDNLYIADPRNNRVRFIHNPTGSGTLNTYPGTTGINISGPINEAGGEPSCGEIFVGTGMDVDASGNLYIADDGHNQIVKVTPSGTATVIAGTGTAGFSGDGGSASLAKLSRPTSVAVDKNGNVYIADYLNNRIRKIDAATNIITTIAGTSSSGFSGDGGAATSATLSHPVSVTVDDGLRVYFSDMRNNRVRVIDPTSGNICTVAGNGNTCTTGCPYIAEGVGSNFTQSLGDGSNATGAELWFPAEVKVDKWGNLFVVDVNHDRIRYICAPQTSCTSAPQATVSITANLGNVICQQSVTYTASTLYTGCNPTYQWTVNGANVGSNSPTYTYNPSDGDAVQCTVSVAASPYAGSCGSATNVISNTISMTVYPAPTGSMTLTSSSIICGSGCVSIQFTGPPNGILEYDNPVTMTSNIVHLDFSGSGSAFVCLPTNTGTTPVSYYFNLDNVIDPGSACYTYIGSHFTVTVVPSTLVATIGSSISVCAGGTGCIPVTGTPGATVAYNYSGAISGSSYVTLDATGNGCIYFTAPVTPFVYIVNYSLTSVSYGGDCSVAISGSASANVISPTATMSVVFGSSVVCNGGCITVQITGTPNSVVVYNDPITLTSNIVTLNSSGIGTFKVCPPHTTSATPIIYTFSLDHIIDPNGCYASLSQSIGLGVVACGQSSDCFSAPSNLMVTGASGNPCHFNANVTFTLSAGSAFSSVNWTYPSPTTYGVYVSTTAGPGIPFSFAGWTGADVVAIVNATDNEGQPCTDIVTHTVGCDQGNALFKTGSQNASGVLNVETNSEISVYPNPTTDEINVESTYNITSVVLFDVSGKTLDMQHYDNKLKVSLSLIKYPSGTYFIKVNSGKSFVITKL